MKRNLKLLLGILLLSVTSSMAQSNAAGGDKYVFVISKVNYLKAIHDAVSASQEQGLNIEEARVILCGESVKAFQEKNPIIDSALREKRIRIYACGLSLDQMKVDPEILPSNVSVVRNGILEGMILEKQGYKKFDL